jgi:GTPase SAR1 and related small G proteins
MLEKKVYVLGAEGCGKSSLLYALTGADKPEKATSDKNISVRRTTKVEITTEIGTKKKSCCFCVCCLRPFFKTKKKKGKQPRTMTKCEKLTLHFMEAVEDDGRLRAMNYLDTDAVLLCFDVTSYETLANLKEVWLPEVNYYCPDEVPVLLVGLKGDAAKPHPEKEPLRRRASSFFRVRKMDTTQREAERLVNEEHIFAYVQCSSQDGLGLIDLKNSLYNAVTTVTSRRKNGVTAAVMNDGLDVGCDEVKLN